MHSGKNILFFDLETSGFPKKDTPVDILELGMQYVPKLGFSKNIETVSQLYKPKYKIPLEITKITGINETMLLDMPYFDKHLEMIQNKVDQSDVLVAHNAPFDIRCLELWGIDFEGKLIFDTATHSKRLIPHLESHTMGSLCNYFGIENNGTHRAIFDVNAMIKIYSKITDLNLYGKQIEELQKKHKILGYMKK